MKKTLFSSLIGILLLTGCVGWPSPQSRATTLNTLILELWTSHQSANVGQQVTIRFTVKNLAEKTVVYERNGAPVMDILIPAGIPAVRWSDGKSLTPELTRLELKPGESRVLEMIWAPSREYIHLPITIGGRVWWCDYNDTCYNEVRLGVTVGFVYGPFP